MPRILILDDDPGIAALFQEVLTMAGFEAVSTTSEHEALLILRTQEIDLLTQDSVRPNMNGEEFLCLLKNEPDLQHIPVLLITGSRWEVCAELLQQWGLHIELDVAGFLEKPCEMRDLLDTIEDILLKHGKSLPSGETYEAARAQRRNRKS